MVLLPVFNKYLGKPGVDSPGRLTVRFLMRVNAAFFE